MKPSFALILLLFLFGLPRFGAAAAPAEWPASGASKPAPWFSPVSAWYGAEAALHADPKGARGTAAVYKAGAVQDTVRAVVKDPWLGFDKVQHFAFSALMTVGAQYTLVNKAELSEGRALPVSIVASGAVGLMKEVYDLRRSPSRHFSRRDLVADAAGILIATGLILL